MSNRHPLKRRPFYGKLKATIVGPEVTNILPGGRKEVWTRVQGGFLGDGGFGAVWLESNEKSQLRAVKVIRRSQTVEKVETNKAIVKLMEDEKDQTVVKVETNKNVVKLMEDEKDQTVVKVETNKNVVKLMEEKDQTVVKVKRDPKDQKVVKLAVKEKHEKKQSVEEVQKVIEREVLALKELREYAWFVQFFGWFNDTENIYLAMEFIEFGHLGKFIGDTGRQETEAQFIAKQILMGLEVMHRNNLCHRDLKPENILVARESPIRVVIADFGLAKRWSKESKLVTMGGTRGFMAPEITSNFRDPEHDYTSAVDVWSLGCVVHQILMGCKSDTEPLYSARAQALKEYRRKGVSGDGSGFILNLTQREAGRRPRVKDALNDIWVLGAKGVDENGQTLLHHAVLVDTVAVVGQLLKMGGMLDTADSEGTTPLHLTAKGGRQDVAKLLLHSGANKEAQDTNGQTPLHLAADGGRVGVVKMLLDYGADKEANDITKKTPLHLAAERGHGETVAELLASEADVEAKDKNDQTPLHLAADGGRVGAVKELLEKMPDTAIKDCFGRTALHIAAEGNRVEVVKALLRKANTIEVRDNEDLTALHLATAAGYEQVVNVLLASGSMIDASESFYCYTPLHLAAESGMDSIVTALLGEKARTDLTDVEGRTALHLAAKSGHAKVIDILMQHGNKTNVKDAAGLTPLHSAAKARQLDAVFELVKHKHSLAELDFDDLTPAEVAGRSLSPILEFLAENLSDITTSDDWEFVKQLARTDGLRTVLL